MYGVSMPITYKSMGPDQGGSASLEDIASQDSAFFCTEDMSLGHIATWRIGEQQQQHGHATGTPLICMCDLLQQANSMDEDEPLCNGLLLRARLFGTDLLSFPILAFSLQKGAYL